MQCSLQHAVCMGAGACVAACGGVCGGARVGIGAGDDGSVGTHPVLRSVD